MPTEPEELRVMGDGNVYRAPVGTPFPETWDEEIDLDEWTDLGYVTEEGPRFVFARETKDKFAWQSMDPIRTIVTKLPKSVKFALEQTNFTNLRTALGGGEVTETEEGNFHYEPPEPSDVDEFALIIEGRDGDLVYRVMYRRAQNLGNIEFAFVREDTVDYEIEVKILQPSGGEKPFLIQTNDDALAELLAS